MVKEDRESAAQHATTRVKGQATLRWLGRIQEKKKDADGENTSRY